MTSSAWIHPKTIPPDDSAHDLNLVKVVIRIPLRQRRLDVSALRWRRRSRLAVPVFVLVLLDHFGLELILEGPHAGIRTARDEDGDVDQDLLEVRLGLLDVLRESLDLPVLRSLKERKEEVEELVARDARRAEVRAAPARRLDFLCTGRGLSEVSREI